MTPGIFETVFERSTLEETFGAVAAAGFKSVQVHLPSAGIDPAGPTIDSDVLEQVRSASTRTAVSIAAIDGTYNMAHPDPEVRSAGHRQLTRTIEIAARLDVAFVTLCTGTRDTSNMWRFHPDNVLDDAWIDMTGSVTIALSVALEFGVTLLVEPEPAKVVNSAAKARILLDQLADDHLKIVLDPANIVLSNRSVEPADVLSESFALLGPDIRFAHAKDLSRTDEFCAAGTGIVPWERYWDLLRGIDYRGPVIFHTLRESDVPRALSNSPWGPGRV